jgi:mannose-1-phosphate guanylyltransferase/mannose-1-phosphate guanylyltransferase/mannose-6-phosphate isomerase
MQKETFKPFYDKRPWGEELWLTEDKPSMVKVITVSPGEFNSLQYHHNRDEYWYILSGNGYATIDDKEIFLEPGSSCFIPRGIKHRFKGGTEKLTLIELAYGDFDEKDIVRLEDKYGRA